MKTVSTGIRYKVDEVEFIKKREQLISVQNVFSFLISEYIKLYKVEKPSVFQKPKDQLKEIGGEQIPTKKGKSFSKYLDEISDLQFDEEFRGKAAEIANDENLTGKQKDLLYLNMRQSKN